MKPQLASNNKIKKLPRETRGVKSALLRAMDDAQKQNWKKVIIVGQSSNENGLGLSIRHSELWDYEILGLLEQGKKTL